MEPPVLTLKISSPPTPTAAGEARGQAAAGAGVQRHCGPRASPARIPAVPLAAGRDPALMPPSTRRIWARRPYWRRCSLPVAGLARRRARPARLRRSSPTAGLAAPSPAYGLPYAPALRPRPARRRPSLPACGQTGAVDSRPRRWCCWCRCSSPAANSVLQLLKSRMRTISPSASPSLLGVLVLLLLGAFTPRFLFRLRCCSLLQLCSLPALCCSYVLPCERKFDLPTALLWYCRSGVLSCSVLRENLGLDWLVCQERNEIAKLL
ncbi:uncharacterized protein LOC112888005 isoform X2 [Panicum hallii]|uniref:uncharacterized protein LOC112888005 isoform X2 n=1 Tax=Panicum hallii TaxID=206008 RepID=UPI000DF4CF38|nr:uncharacterized protein LOC112888005 isoform X2 [Panicum hallii]